MLDNEVQRARIKGISISPEVIEILRYNQNQRVVNLAKELKIKFGDKKLVPTDSIVIELILIKKSTLRFIDIKERRNPENVWPFALTRDVYNQLLKSNDSLRNTYLKEILFEYHEIFNTKKEEYWELAKTDRMYEKYENREYWQRNHRDIKKEVNIYWDSLNLTRN